MINQLKLGILSFLLVPGLTFGQVNNFNFVQYDTIYTGDDTNILLEGNIFNLAGIDQSITVTKLQHYRPLEWTIFFCAGPVCLPDVVNSQTFTLASDDTAYFDLQIYTNGFEGAGSWTFFTVDSSTMEVDSIHITVNVGTVSIDDQNFIPGDFKLSQAYPNLTNAWINFELDAENVGNYSISLHSLDGRAIISHNYLLQSGKNHLSWSLGNLPSGQYILTANNNGNIHSRKLIVVK
jgi:hypothetical protein